MQKEFFEEMVYKEQLQKIQDEFCAVTGVLAYCLDENKEAITRLSGDGELQKEVLSETCQELAAIALERVEDGSLEEQAVESLENIGVRVAAIAVRVEDASVVYWVIFDFSKREEVLFFQILDLLHDASHTIFYERKSHFSAEAETRRSRYAEAEMGRSLHAIEATTEIVQLLDSDQQIELIMDKWLEILAGYLEVDTAQLFQLDADDTYMNVICEWCNTDKQSVFESASRIEVPNFLRTEKPMVISTNILENEYQKEARARGLSATMVFPVFKPEDGRNLVLCLNYRVKKHIWTMPEIKFASDAVRVLHSILMKRVQRDILSNSHDSLEAVLDNVGCAVYVEDKKDGRMLFANRHLQNNFAKELQENVFGLMLQEEINREHTGNACELYHAVKARYYDVVYKEISWVDGRKAILYSLYDITEKKIYQKRIEQQAYTDFLTGLYNRMCCERDIARQIDSAKKEGLQGAILYLDLDDFKHINDGLGHQYGDTLLRSISAALRSVEGIEHTCYRMGGDEFVIVIPPGSYARFEGIIEDIKAIFDKPWFLKDADYYCTMSMGVVTYPDGGESVADLIKKADIAMYKAKKTGKNRVAEYTEDCDFESGKRLDMEKNMREATAAHYEEFAVYYQPIVDIWGDEPTCIGAEALIRWNSQNLGAIPPSEFIPLAEYLGLINPIGNFILEEACRQCKYWNDNGHPEYSVDVNLSVVQLLQPDIVDIIADVLKKTGLKPRNLALEVTESLAINDMERMKEILYKIKELGVLLALDDFGTGYSSLNHIREIPVDIIKVDQSFVKDLTEDAYSQAFIKMVAELAETIDVYICVEGIETAEQYKVLQDMKVRFIQGFYFDRPMTQEDFIEKYISGVAKKS